MSEIEALKKQLEEARATIETLDAIRVEDHMWFDHKCHRDGCQSLVLQAKLAENARLREALANVEKVNRTLKAENDYLQAKLADKP